MDWLYHRKTKIEKPRGRRFHRITLSIVLVVPGVAMSDTLEGEEGRSEVRFNTDFIHGSEQPADLKTFLEGNSVLPGTYRVDIYLNRSLKGRRDLLFIKSAVTGRV